MSIGSFYSDIVGNADIIMERPPVKSGIFRSIPHEVKKIIFCNARIVINFKTTAEQRKPISQIFGSYMRVPVLIHLSVNDFSVLLRSTIIRSTGKR